MHTLAVRIARDVSNDIKFLFVRSLSEIFQSLLVCVPIIGSLGSYCQEMAVMVYIAS